jgi:hypothetical protein
MSKIRRHISVCLSVAGIAFVAATMLALKLTSACFGIIAFVIVCLALINLAEVFNKNEVES